LGIARCWYQKKGYGRLGASEMRLTKVYARFYKSFNFDHLRKAHPSAEPKPWEMYEDSWFPYVEVPIDAHTTAIVGANESGKSHLLSAIEKAITGLDFQQRDLCRYSPFFNVELGRTCWPHLGVGWADLDEGEAAALCKELKIDSSEQIEAFEMFREGPDRLVVHVNAEVRARYELEGERARCFGLAFLPKPFRIKPDIALPNSVPLKYLVDPDDAYSTLGSRRVRSNYVEAGLALRRFWPRDPNGFAQVAPQLFNAANGFFSGSDDSERVTDEMREALKLARSLLIQLANLDPKRLADLSNAIADGDDGHANALMARINDQLAKELNFQKWWVQDRDFSLQVTSREFDLVFTVKDRTGTEYTFNERSSGLKYFLSYLIQSRVHEASRERSEILLMDEPDTYLSAEAQQDLLKIFDAFAEPKGNSRPVQVVYVTHSPFLLDKNHAERIRVLQKGKAHDGTRVIRNASQNHYEPLRSAFGAFVGETAFVGACNLLVEGISDQIILAGIARLTRCTSQLSNNTLDLNKLVIVPCGSATQIPYMLYLIRGRDTEKPPVVALLDSDSEGNQIARKMRGQDKRLSKLIKKEFVLQVGELSYENGDTAFGPLEIEDLIPRTLARLAANACLTELAKFQDDEGRAPISEEEFSEHNGPGKLFDALNGVVSSRGAHIEKTPFARAIVDICRTSPELQEVKVFLSRMTVLFSAINLARRQAELDNLKDRVGKMIDRQQRLFARDNADGANRESGLIILENIQTILDDSLESDAVRAQIIQIRRRFQLNENPTEPIHSYEKFKEQLGALKDAFHIAQLDV
jgi:predicted ATPase